MKLDFTAIREPTDKPPESPETALNGTDGQNKPVDGKTPNTAPQRATEQAGQLTNRYSLEQAEHERNTAIYKDYQNNIKATGELRTQLLKGVKAGEPPVLLLLKAVECISLMTSDKLFYSQIEGDIRSIYGAGLLEREPLELELESVKKRLEKLEQARKRETGDSKKRIEAAIQAHRKRAAELKNLIEKNGETQL